MEKLKTLLIILFPVLGFSFKELWNTFNESWVGKYIIAWIVGILIIHFFLLILLVIGSFVFWTIPTFTFTPITGEGAWFFRGLLVLYSFIVLFITNDEF